MENTNNNVVIISVKEYGSLIACRTILDMILASRSGSGYADSAVLKCADEQRKLHMDMPVIHPLDSKIPEGDGDA